LHVFANCNVPFNLSWMEIGEETFYRKNMWVVNLL
jgi:hypothetical protein